MFVHKNDDTFYEVDTPSFKDLQKKLLHVYQEDEAGSDDYNSDDDKKCQQSHLQRKVKNDKK